MRGGHAQQLEIITILSKAIPDVLNQHVNIEGPNNHVRLSKLNACKGV